MELEPEVLPEKISKPIPTQFTCPISHTGEVMTTPIIVFPSGKTYEKSTIEEWLTSNNTDPLTREIITAKAINWSIKTQIDEFLVGNPEHKPEESQKNEKEIDGNKVATVNNDARDGNPPVDRVSNSSAGSCIKSPIGGAIVGGTITGISTEIVLLTSAKSIGAVAGVVGGLGAAAVGGTAGYSAAILMQRYGLCCYNTGSNNRDATYEVSGTNENSSLQQNPRAING